MNSLNLSVSNDTLLILVGILALVAMVFIYLNASKKLSALVAAVERAAPPKLQLQTKLFPLGFPSTVVHGEENASISAQPQIPFRGEDLMVTFIGPEGEDCSANVVITDLKVGKNSQLVAANPLPGASFSPTASRRPLLHFDTADVAQFITMSISNRGKRDILVNAILVGRAVDEDHPAMSDEDYEDLLNPKPTKKGFLTMIFGGKSKKAA
jgi:hypothetical protein